jgi:hypothetical protein
MVLELISQSNRTVVLLKYNLINKDLSWIEKQLKLCREYQLQSTNHILKERSLIKLKLTL